MDRSRTNKPKWIRMGSRPHRNCNDTKHGGDRPDSTIYRMASVIRSTYSINHRNVQFMKNTKFNDEWSSKRFMFDWLRTAFSSASMTQWREWIGEHCIGVHRRGKAVADERKIIFRLAVKQCELNVPRLQSASALILHVPPGTVRFRFIARFKIDHNIYYAHLIIIIDALDMAWVGRTKKKWRLRRTPSDCSFARTHNIGLVRRNIRHGTINFDKRLPSVVSLRCHFVMCTHAALMHNCHENPAALSIDSHTEWRITL